ncbi:DUF2750 domain-containing protein [Flaviaesturariibacter amylovorans]|uniref:DUF2750 domain-containing protein n=1 Tax=Flaviaesturariibacter amylovorans TaxID=1084520 RepID=A0ABP8HR15_9BACT
MTPTPASEHQSAFINRIIETGTVWALSSDEGFATSESDEYEDVEVLPFWSEEAAAAVLARDEWAEFKPASLPLAEFLEKWLPGMYSEDVVVGIDWDAEMTGTETEPLDLALAVAEALKQSGKPLAFEHHDDVDDYITQLQGAMGEE